VAVLLFLPQEGTPAATLSPAFARLAESWQKTSEVPQKPKLEQHTFKGQIVLPSAEYLPHGALASQLATQVFGDEGEQCSERYPH
jgi:hypothetical protein